MFERKPPPVNSNEVFSGWQWLGYFKCNVTSTNVKTKSMEIDTATDVEMEKCK